VGALTVIIWKQLEGGIFDMYEILPGFILCTLAIVVVSLLDTAPSRQIQTEFEAVAKAMR
jgi:sodium/proline symporter